MIGALVSLCLFGALTLYTAFNPETELRTPLDRLADKLRD